MCGVIVWGRGKCQFCAPQHAAGHAAGAANVSPILDWEFIHGLIHLLFSEFENHFFPKTEKISH